MTNKYRYFLESNFVGVNRLFVLIYSNQDVKIKNHYKLIAADLSRPKN